MIPHYEKRCAEIPIRPTDSKKLQKVLGAITRSYSNAFTALLAAVPGGSAPTQGPDDDLTSWLKGPKNQPLIIGMFAPKASHDPVCFLQLQAMERLETSFGKKHHKKNMAYLLTYSFSGDHAGKDAIDKLHSSLGKSIATAFRRKKPPEIVPIFQVNRTIRELEKKPNSTPAISTQQASILELFEDAAFRSTLIRTRQAKDPTFVNIVKSTGLAEATVRQNLDCALDRNIVTRQYNAVCTKCSTALARARQIDNIERMAADGIACPKCKTQLTGESFEECYAVDPKVAELVDGSKWMCMHFRHNLSPFVASGSILSEVIDGPNELDVVANVDGSLVLVELKDAQFSIGHAYSFVGKCSQYRPDIPIVCTTEQVDKDVKEYLTNTGINAEYIEGLKGLQDRLAAIFSKQHAEALVRLLSEVPLVPMLTRQMLANFGERPPARDEGYEYYMPHGYPMPRTRWRR